MKRFIYKLKRWMTARYLILLGIELYKRSIERGDTIKAAYHAEMLYEDCYQMSDGPKILSCIFYMLHRKDLKQIEKFYDSYVENGFA